MNIRASDISEDIYESALEGLELVKKYRGMNPGVINDNDRRNYRLIYDKLFQWWKGICEKYDNKKDDIDMEDIIKVYEKGKKIEEILK